MDGLPVLVEAPLGRSFMIVGAVILRGGVASGDDHGGNLNMRVVLLDTAAGAAADAGRALTGAVILTTGGFAWLDPTVAMFITIVIGYHALVLQRDV